MAICSQCLSTTWKIDFSPSPKTTFGLIKWWKLVRSVWRPLEISFYQPHVSRIWACHEEENDFKDSWKHWNIFLSTSSKSNFGFFKRQKLTFKCHSTTWIVALSTWKSRIFGRSRSRKLLQISIQHINHLFLDFTQIEIWGGQEAKNEFAVPCNHLIHRFLERTQTAF